MAILIVTACMIPLMLALGLLFLEMAEESTPFLIICVLIVIGFALTGLKILE